MTIEEIVKAAETTPDLIKQITSSFKDSITKELETSGLVIRTPEQDAAYVTSAVAAQLPGKIGEEFGKTMNGIDAKLFEIYGIEKKAGEKTTDYAARAAAETKKAPADPVTKQRVTELEAQLAKVTADHEKQIGELNTSLFNRELEFQLSGALDKANIAVPAHLKTEDEKQGYVAMQRQLIKSGFSGLYTPKKDDQGNIIYYDGEKPQISQKDGKPKTASDLVSERFASYFIPAGQAGAGSGTRVDGAGGAGVGFKSKDDVHAHLASQGLTAGSKAYMEEFSKLTTDSKIDV